MSAPRNYWRTHGLSGSPTHKAWKNMVQRCTNQRLPEFKHYGARGIRICDRWRSFKNFLADMGVMPAAGLTLDRIDNDGNYEPGNCRWATRQQQAENTRATSVVIVRGEPASLNEWARRSGLKKSLIRDRIRRGWSPESAVLTPRLRT
jgi:hypothetical protein